MMWCEKGNVPNTFATFKTCLLVGGGGGGGRNQKFSSYFLHVKPILASNTILSGRESRNEKGGLECGGGNCKEGNVPLPHDVFDM